MQFNWRMILIGAAIGLVAYLAWMKYRASKSEAGEV